VSVCAVIPFYNEFNTVKEAVTASLNYVDIVFAVNDGSVDNSEKEIENLERVNLINLKTNKGKGEALKIGFKKALSLNFSKVITLDADLQHDTAFIPELISALDNYDIVIGNRLSDLESMPLQRRLSNKITSFLLSLKTGQEILDSQCGFRGYNASVLKNVDTTYSGFEAESEILVLGAKKGFTIGSIKIPTKYSARKSKIKPIKTIIGFLKVIINK
jgi:glycosyltransferase involved in cell wall biosynthesis